MSWTGPMTHRQFLVWQEWESAQWNEPDRHDHYLMAVALQVEAIRLGFSKTSRTPRMDDHRLKFRTREEMPVLSVEQRVARSKSFWRAVMANPGPPPNGTK